MQVPKDQGLFFTIFVVMCVGIIVSVWYVMPLHRVTKDEAEEEPTSSLTLPKAVTPEERITQMEKALAMASAAIATLDKEKAEPQQK